MRAKKNSGVAHKKSKTEAGQIGMKTGGFPPCSVNGAHTDVNGA